MARRFHDKTQPEWPWDEDAVAAFFGHVIERGYCTISEAGFFAGGMSAHPLAPEWLVASEYLWWAEDDSAARHALGFRRWAKTNGANEIRWSCRADNDRVSAFFARISTPVEHHYSEVLPCA